jgi:hypothetical protein
MSKLLIAAPILALSLLNTVPAYALSFFATYNSTVGAGSSFSNVSEGNTLRITYELDNGGSSLVSQTWTAANLKFVTFDFNNGANRTVFAPNTAPGNGLSIATGNFVTNASGLLTAVPSDWRDVLNVNVLSTDNSQIPSGWFVNGGNGIIFAASQFVSDASVARNIVAANWTITVPFDFNPSVGLVVLGGVFLANKSFKKAKKKAIEIK